MEKIPEGYVPWFEVPERKSRKATVIFGHWSALGLKVTPNVIALDTGCLWGGPMTAIRLEDRQLFQVSCKQPGGEKLVGLNQYLRFCCGTTGPRPSMWRNVMRPLLRS